VGGGTERETDSDPGSNGHYGAISPGAGRGAMGVIPHLWSYGSLRPRRIA
jgi:hypothetical protein